MSACKFCGKEIQWRKDGGKNIAINPDGSFHKPTCKGSDPAPATNGHAAIIGRVTEYEGSNVHISTKVLFIPTEYRRIWQEKYPVGSAVSAINDRGTCKGMDILTGPNLEKFLKDEEAQRNQQTLPEMKQAQTAEHQPAQPAAAQQDLTSPKSVPVVQKREPVSRDLILSMVNNPDTYWKAKTLMDIEQHESICRQVEWKNWQESVNTAIEYHQRAEDGLSTEEDLREVFSTAEKIHVFIQGKVRAGSV